MKVIKYKIKKTRYKELTYNEIKKYITKDTILVDVRSEQEYKDGHIQGAISIPLYEIILKAKKMLPNKKQLIILYCQLGLRSKKAAGLLKSLGYTNVINIKGGIENI